MMLLFFIGIVLLLLLLFFFLRKFIYSCLNCQDEEDGETEDRSRQLDSRMDESPRLKQRGGDRAGPAWNRKLDEEKFGSCAFKDQQFDRNDSWPRSLNEYDTPQLELQEASVPRRLGSQNIEHSLMKLCQEFDKSVVEGDVLNVNSIEIE